MVDTVAINMEYGQTIVECPLYNDGFMCDLRGELCTECPLVVVSKEGK